MVDGLIGLMNNGNSGGKVYNIGSDEEITIEKLAELVISKTDSNSRKQFVSYEDAYGREIDDMARRIPSLVRIREEIAYEPKISLDRSLEIIIDYFKGIIFRV